MALEQVLRKEDKTLQFKNKKRYSLGQNSLVFSNSSFNQMMEVPDLGIVASGRRESESKYSVGYLLNEGRVGFMPNRFTSIPQLHSHGTEVVVSDGRQAFHLLNGQLTERYSEIVSMKLYSTGALVHGRDERRQEVCYSSYDCHETTRIAAKQVLGMALQGKNILVIEKHGWKLLADTVAHLYDLQGRELDTKDLCKGQVIMPPSERNGMLAFITQSPGYSMERYQYLFSWLSEDMIETTGLSYQPTNWVPLAGAPLIYAGPQLKHGQNPNPDIPAILGGQPIEAKRIEKKIRLDRIRKLFTFSS